MSTPFAFTPIASAPFVWYPMQPTYHMGAFLCALVHTLAPLPFGPGPITIYLPPNLTTHPPNRFTTYS